MSMKSIHYDPNTYSDEVHNTWFQTYKESSWNVFWLIFIYYYLNIELDLICFILLGVYIVSLFFIWFTFSFVSTISSWTITRLNPWKHLFICFVTLSRLLSTVESDWLSLRKMFSFVILLGLICCNESHIFCIPDVPKQL